VVEKSGCGCGGSDVAGAGGSVGRSTVAEWGNEGSDGVIVGSRCD